MLLAAVTASGRLITGRVTLNHVRLHFRHFLRTTIHPQLK